LGLGEERHRACPNYQLGRLGLVVTQHSDMGGPVDDMKAKNHFERLGLQPSADANAVKLAYLKAARQYHPDVNSAGASAEVLKERSALFALIVEANSTLSDPLRRGVYLAQLNARASTGGSREVATRPSKAAQEAFNKGKIQRKARNYAAALELFTQATTLDPANAEALAWRGFTRYLATPDKAEGLKDIQKAIAMNGSIAEAYYFLGSSSRPRGTRPGRW
jgi:curved DNA-binding protein CbpA